MTELDLLRFFNLTLANPVLDLVMVTLTYAGLALTPAAGVYQLVRGDKKLGRAVLVAIVVSFALAMAFQFTALRPRPVPFRVVIPTPNFPSFPSGHAAIVFSAAVAAGLVLRRRWVWVFALGSAAAITVSRIYLGVHYASDLLAGAILGAASGAAVYGLMYRGRGFRGGLRWLLWIQIAVVLLVTMMAYLDLVPDALLAWRYADKVFHFLLVGLAAFWLSFWETPWDPVVLGRRMALPLLVFVVLVAGEELLQGLSPYRRMDIYDFAADMLGVAFFWGLRRRLNM